MVPSILQGEPAPNPFELYIRGVEYGPILSIYHLRPNLPHAAKVEVLAYLRTRNPDVKISCVGDEIAVSVRAL